MVMMIMMMIMMVMITVILMTMMMTFIAITMMMMTMAIMMMMTLMMMMMLITMTTMALTYIFFLSNDPHKKDSGNGNARWNSNFFFLLLQLVISLAYTQTPLKSSGSRCILSDFLMVSSNLRPNRTI